MKNGTYKEITDLELGQNINFFYYKAIDWLTKKFKKGHELAEPVAIIIKGDSKLVVPLENQSKEAYVASLKVACHFLDAEAIMIFSEASRWTGTEEERQFVIQTMGDIHGHVKSVDIFMVSIETKGKQGKQIIGLADVEAKGSKRMLKAMKWNLQDMPKEEDALFSNFLNKNKETV
ncbi:hypothetical protein KTD15_06090 [Burkholderia multivorans]|uniref:hypothetical protein n=1 Tax=Burkholderia multivorans TaxID=87883 RepID=UPI001C222006|nr:hypothetical protein [Burkholderia multivorans]MBU9118363.1 hypothetical protein [Burkholderia multivorans]